MEQYPISHEPHYKNPREFSLILSFYHLYIFITGSILLTGAIKCVVATHKMYTMHATELLMHSGILKLHTYTHAGRLSRTVRLIAD